jgi:hypothetical protein
LKIFSSLKCDGFAVSHKLKIKANQGRLFQIFSGCHSIDVKSVIFDNNR